MGQKAYGIFCFILFIAIWLLASHLDSLAM